MMMDQSRFLGQKHYLKRLKEYDDYKRVGQIEPMTEKGFPYALNRKLV